MQKMLSSVSARDRRRSRRPRRAGARACAAPAWAGRSSPTSTGRPRRRRPPGAAGSAPPSSESRSTISSGAGSSRSATERQPGSPASSVITARTPHSRKWNSSSASLKCGFSGTPPRRRAGSPGRRSGRRARSAARARPGRRRSSPRAGQAAGEPVDLLAQLAVGDPLVAVDQRDPIEQARPIEQLDGRCLRLHRSTAAVRPRLALVHADLSVRRRVGRHRIDQRPRLEHVLLVFRLVVGLHDDRPAGADRGRLAVHHDRADHDVQVARRRSARGSRSRRSRPRAPRPRARR